MENIVERLKRAARNFSVRRDCNCREGLHADDCKGCKQMKLLWEAAKEIEELRKSHSTSGDLLSK